MKKKFTIYITLIIINLIGEHVQALERYSITYNQLAISTFFSGEEEENTASLLEEVNNVVQERYNAKNKEISALEGYLEEALTTNEN